MMTGIICGSSTDNFDDRVKNANDSATGIVLAVNTHPCMKL
jgi:hypothetical protein